MTVRRFDQGSTTSRKLLPNGWLRADATISRTGIQTYRRADGVEVREYRPPEEVFDAEAMASFSMVPVTDEHPPVLLDSTNSRAYARGHLGETVERAGDKVHATILVTDADLVAAIQSGAKEQVSCGYVCDLDPTPGEIDGEPYDCIQRRIRGNHLAVTIAGRAGPEVRVLDNADAVAIRGDREEPIAQDLLQERTVKTEIAGITFDVADPVAQALEKERKDRADEKAKADSALEELAKTEKSKTAELDQARARTDAAEAKAKRTDSWVPMCFGMRCQPGSICCQGCPCKVACASVYGCPVPGEPAGGAMTMDSATAAAKAGQKEHADSVLATARTRSELESKVRAILGAEAKLDGSDLELKRLALAKLKPTLKLDGQSDVYVATAYDIAVGEAAETSGQAGLAALRGAIPAPKTDAKPPEQHLDAAAARAEFVKRTELAYQKPTVGVSKD